MLTINLGKIDKYLITFLAVIALLATILVVATNGVFKAYLTSQEITEEKVENSLNEDKLNQAYEVVQGKKEINLDLGF